MRVREPCSAEALGRGKASASGAGGAEARGGRLRDDGQYGARQAKSQLLSIFAASARTGAICRRGERLARRRVENLARCSASRT
jgi:hypothetical protein